MSLGSYQGDFGIAKVVFMCLIYHIGRCSSSVFVLGFLVGIIENGKVGPLFRHAHRIHAWYIYPYLP